MITDHAGLWGPDNVVRSDGGPVVSGACHVYLPGTTQHATLYTDRDRTAEAPNPVFTSPIGNLQFHADPGLYDLKVGDTTLRIQVSRDSEDFEVGGKRHVITLKGQWNSPLLTANDVPLPHLSLLSDFADIEPPLTTPVHIIASVAVGSLLDDPQLADRPTEWIVAQDAPQADIYGVLVIPLDNQPPEYQNVPLWFKFESIDVDGMRTFFYAYSPDGVADLPTDVTLYLFDGYERHEMLVSTPEGDPEDPGPIETHVVRLLAAGDGVAADTMYVDGRDAATLQAAKDYADEHGGGSGEAFQAYVNDAIDAHTEAEDPHGDRGYADSTFIATTAKGAASGVAELDEDGLVPSAQLPGFVDDVREVADEAALAGAVAASGVIYIALAENTQWRWSGSTFVQLGGSLALGETSASAYRGDRGKTAYDHSQAAGNPHGAAVADITGLSTALGNKLDASAVGTAAAKNVPASGDAASGEVVKGNDSRLTDARTPTGSAGGDLTGTFPNPTIGSGKVTSTHILDGTIVDADINSAAAIDATKLATPLTGLYVSGSLYSNPVLLGGSRSISPGGLYFWPLDFDGPATVDGLSINVATGGSSSVAHLYVVSASASTGRPTSTSTILATCSNIATATSSTRVTAAFDGSATLAVTRGRLWGAVHAIVGTATFQACSASQQLGPPHTVASTYSANGLSGIGASGGGTSTTALTTLSGITINSLDVNQGPIIYWRAH